MHHRKTPTFVTLCSGLILAVAAKAGLGQTGSATVVPVRIILATNGESETNYLFTKIKHPELAKNQYGYPILDSLKPVLHDRFNHDMENVDRALKGLGLSSLDVGDTRVYFSTSLYSEKSFDLYRSVMGKIADSVGVDGKVDMSKIPEIVNLAQKSSSGQNSQLDLSGTQPYLQVRVRLNLQEGDQTWSAGGEVSGMKDLKNWPGKEVDMRPLYKVGDPVEFDEKNNDTFGFPNPYSVKFTYLGAHLNNLEKWKMVDATVQFLIDKARKMKEAKDGAVSKLLQKMMQVSNFEGEYGKSWSALSPSLQKLIYTSPENPHGVLMGYQQMQYAISQYGNSVTLTGAQIDFGLQFLVSRKHPTVFNLTIP